MMKTRWVGILLLIALCASPALATVGGGDITFKGGDAGKVLFSHDRHVADAGLKCQDCHAKLYLDTKQHQPATMEEMNQGKSCGACHNGQTAFSVKGDCNRCHSK